TRPSTIISLDLPSRRRDQMHRGPLFKPALFQLILLQHGRRTRICAVKHLLPFLPRRLLEPRREGPSHHWPAGPVAARGMLPPPKSQSVQKRLVELRLESSHREILARVFGLVGVVVGTAAVEGILPRGWSQSGVLRVSRGMAAI